MQQCLVLYGFSSLDGCEIVQTYNFITEEMRLKNIVSCLFDADSRKYSFAIKLYLMSLFCFTIDVYSIVKDIIPIHC